MKITPLGSFILGSILIASQGVSQVTVLSDTFTRADSNALGTTTTGSKTWVESETVATGLRISSNELTAGSTTAGREYAYINTSSLTNYNTTLSSNTHDITWAINIQQTRTDPSGFDGNNYGVGFILASSVSTDIATGSGYAIVLGNGTSADPIRLAKFTGGFNANSDFTNIISSGDFGTAFLNLKVTYKPSTNTWSLFGTSGASFSDPKAVSTQLGSSVVDSTHTSIALSFTGFLWNHATGASDSARFDNLSITSAVPEPSTAAALLGFVALTGAAGLRRRRRA